MANNTHGLLNLEDAEREEVMEVVVAVEIHYHIANQLCLQKWWSCHSSFYVAKRKEEEKDDDD